MKGFRLVIVAFALTVLLGSCSGLFGDKRSKLLLNGEKGLLRGVELDMTMQQVKTIEKDSVAEETPTFLGYQIKGIEKNERLEIEYFFNESGRLDQIMAYYYLDKDEDAERMIGTLKKYFDTKLGTSKKDEQGWHVWEYADKKGYPGDINIVLNKTVGVKGKTIDLEVVKYYESENNSVRTGKK